jgi:hypothetical protein
MMIYCTSIAARASKALCGSKWAALIAVTKLLGGELLVPIRCWLLAIGHT